MSVLDNHDDFPPHPPVAPAAPPPCDQGAPLPLPHTSGARFKSLPQMSAPSPASLEAPDLRPAKDLVSPSPAPAPQPSEEPAPTTSEPSPKRQRTAEDPRPPTAVEPAPAPSEPSGEAAILAKAKFTKGDKVNVPTREGPGWKGGNGGAGKVTRVDVDVEAGTLT